MKHTYNSLQDRILHWSIPVTESGCWLWLGCMNSQGYGNMTMPGRKKVGAHRVAYQAFIGPLSPDLTIDHLCRVRCCVNPAHLEAVTMHMNVMRGISLPALNALAVCCKYGHPLSGANLSIRYRRMSNHSLRYRRVCRLCRQRRNGAAFPIFPAQSKIGPNER
jgi:hypothetical protein